MTEHEELKMWKSMYMRLLRGIEEAAGALTEAEKAAESLYIEAGLSPEADHPVPPDATP